MENKMVDVSKLTQKELQELQKQLREREMNDRNVRRESYEKLRNEMLDEVKQNLEDVVLRMADFAEWLKGESAAFFEIYREYGMVKREEQGGYTISNDGFKLDVQQKKYKSFDERADLAAERLIEFLNNWITGKGDGATNPMYKLAMVMLERNKQGELDYKSVSKLFEMESDFADPQYSEIMQLFKESNIVEKTAIKYYFYQKNENTGCWDKVEPSFNKM